MNVKYAISFSVLIALTGTSCWSAAPNLGKQVERAMANAAMNDDVERLRQLVPAAIAANTTFDEVPNEILVEIAKLLDPQSLGRLAQVNTKFREIVTNMPIYKLLKEHSGNLQTALEEAQEKGNQEAIDYLKKLLQQIKDEEERNRQIEAEQARALEEENERAYNEWLRDQLELEGEDIDTFIIFD